MSVREAAEQRQDQQAAETLRLMLDRPGLVLEPEEADALRRGARALAAVQAARTKLAETPALTIWKSSVTRALDVTL